MLTAAPAALADVQAPSGLVNSGSFDQAITPGASTEARSTLGEEEAAQTIQSDTRATQIWNLRSQPMLMQAILSQST